MTRGREEIFRRNFPVGVEKTNEFAEIPKFCKEAEQTVKLGKPKIQ